VDVQLADCIFRDSIRIEYLSQLPGDRFRDTTICWNQGLHLDAAFPGVISYIWEDGTTGPDKHIYYAGTYWVDLFFGGCTYRDSLTVRFTEALDLLPDHVYLCAGEPVVLNATLEGATYTWPDGSTGPTFTVSEAGFYWVIIQAGKCTYQEYVYVNHAYAPQVFYEDRISLCRGETRLLDVSWVNGPYRWQDGSRESYFLVTRPGTYRVEYTWAGCPVYDSITVEYTDEYPPLLPRQIAFCEGETRLLNAYSPDIWYYHWQDGSYNSTLRVSQPGTYWVDYFRGNCLIRDSVTVSFLPTPALTIRNDTVLCYGKSLTLQAAGDNQSFRWSDGTVGAELTVKAPGTYWVEARDLTTGCLNRQTIRIQQTECWEDLNIPNLITPNGDEFNQFFVIEGLSDHWNLEIMNRWGKPVYQTRAYRNNWDAAGHPSGAYYYRLWNYVSGQTYQGWLQVLR
jgi:large repetitive protein